MPLKNESYFEKEIIIGHNNSHQYHHHNEKNGVSLAFAVFLNFFLTIVCLSATILCLAYVLQRYLRRKELRDKLCNIVSSRYWMEENKLLQGVQLLSRMKEIFIFLDITSYSIVCFKFRTGQFKNDLTVDQSEFKKFNKYSSQLTNVYEVLLCIERFFDTLSLQLLCRGKCPDVVSRVIGPTVFHLARETCLAWSDLKSPLIHKLVGYFSGSSCAEVFRSSLISDNGLASMVTSRVPYVSCLILVDGCLVMKDIDFVFDSKIDLGGKIRFIDVVLAKKDSGLKGLPKKTPIILNPETEAEDQLIGECFLVAKEMCSKLHLMSDNMIKQIDTKGSSFVNLRHMLRIMSCLNEHFKKLKSDQQFFHLIVRLFEGFYSNHLTKEEALLTLEVDSVLLEVMDRTRNNILKYLDDIIEVGPRLNDDKNNTKLKLQQIEQDLQLHLNYLTLKQVQGEPQKNKLGTRNSQRKKKGLGNMTESEVSIYSMAQSSSCVLRPQVHLYDNQMRHINSNPEYIDKASFLSSLSSMYATATSLNSPIPPSDQRDSLNSPKPTSFFSSNRKNPLKVKSVTLPLSDSDEVFNTR